MSRIEECHRGKCSSSSHSRSLIKEDIKEDDVHWRNVAQTRDIFRLMGSSVNVNVFWASEWIENATRVSELRSNQKINNNEKDKQDRVTVDDKCRPNANRNRLSKTIGKRLVFESGKRNIPLLTVILMLIRFADRSLASTTCQTVASTILVEYDKPKLEDVILNAFVEFC